LHLRQWFRRRTRSSFRKALTLAAISAAAITAALRARTLGFGSTPDRPGLAFATTGTFPFAPALWAWTARAAIAPALTSIIGRTLAGAAIIGIARLLRGFLCPRREKMQLQIKILV
jgi:hypothetical protein